MKKSSQSVASQDHAKPFMVAIGIAFTFLALVVLYIAFSKGGFDIRSRAATAASCRNRVPNQSKCFEVNCSRITNSWACSAQADANGKKCCVWSAAIIPTAKPTMRISTYPTKKPTPTNRPTYRPTPTATSKRRIIIGLPSSSPRKPSSYPTPTP